MIISAIIVKSNEKGYSISQGWQRYGNGRKKSIAIPRTKRHHMYIFTSHFC